ncbi:hypothetical protein CMI48_01250 [Candidatus Pacearchaeota archaeon]|nr:hypothetical protein [Candidatus Pacearchaeota archaeon]
MGVGSVFYVIDDRGEVSGPLPLSVVPRDEFDLHGSIVGRPTESPETYLGRVPVEDVSSRVASAGGSKHYAAYTLRSVNGNGGKK